MTQAEALAVLDRYRYWNAGQTSVSFARGGPRTAEDVLYDTRRELLIAATRVLASSATVHS